jgi:hypothetical protein
MGRVKRSGAAVVVIGICLTALAVVPTRRALVVARVGS